MKYKNFLLRAVNLLLILGVLWQYCLLYTSPSPRDVYKRQGGTMAIPAGDAGPGSSGEPAQAGDR